MEWLFATAEEPHTHGEVTGAIDRALEALQELATKEETTKEIIARNLRAAIDRLHDEGGTPRRGDPQAGVKASEWLEVRIVGHQIPVFPTVAQTKT